MKFTVFILNMERYANIYNFKNKKFREAYLSIAKDVTAEVLSTFYARQLFSDRGSKFLLF
jgi:hypothetical protein